MIKRIHEVFIVVLSIVTIVSGFTIIRHINHHPQLKAEDIIESINDAIDDNAFVVKENVEINEWGTSYEVHGLKNFILNLRDNIDAQDKRIDRLMAYLGLTETTRPAKNAEIVIEKLPEFAFTTDGSNTLDWDEFSGGSDND